MSEIWNQPATVEGLNAPNHNTMGEMLGIQFTEIGADSITATMPVTASTVQPYRILHGGANVALAETLGSVASTLCLAGLATQSCVGLGINPGVTKPVRLGRQVHVWQIEIRDEKGELSCISRLTVAIVDRR